jgi:hypothetical protein
MLAINHQLPGRNLASAAKAERSGALGDLLEAFAAKPQVAYISTAGFMDRQSFRRATADVQTRALQSLFASTPTFPAA